MKDVTMQDGGAAAGATKAVSAANSRSPLRRKRPNTSPRILTSAWWNNDQQDEQYFFIEIPRMSA